MPKIEFGTKVKLQMFLDHELQDSIMDDLEHIFTPDRDPEVAWASFRKRLSKLKARHVKLYEKYMDVDDDTEPEQSAIAKWRESRMKCNG